MTKTTAKLFMHGRSQAVRLPKEFRFSGKEVAIERHGDDVILRPVKSTSPDWRKIFDEMETIGTLDDFLPDRMQGLTEPKLSLSDD